MKKYIKYGVIVGIVITFIVGLLWPVESKIFYAEMSIKDYGKIELELNGEEAPITVDNFVKLVNDKFYDGLTFHRIIDGFMMQGGEGNSEIATIKGEFSSNGVENNIKHERGVISMARTNEPDSATSQFFIVHKTSSHLDGNYAAFGKVISGMDVVDKVIKATASYGDDNGMLPTDNQPVIEYIKMIEKEK